MQKLLLYYLIAINLFTFVLFGWDKYLAKAHKRRISERELHIMSAMGGFIGGSLAMYFFRHKTAKSSFLLKHIVIMLLWIGYGLYYFAYLNPLNFIR